MAITRSRRIIILTAGSVLAAITALAVAGELVARSQIDSTLDSLTEDTQGVAASFTDGFALWSFATGRVGFDISVDDTALQEILDCRTDREVVVSTTTAGIGVETDIQLRGRSVPVHVTLVPRKDGGAWSLVPDAVGVAGITLPPQQGAGFLGDRAPDWLGSGIPLPPTGGLSVTAITPADGETRISISAPIAQEASGRDNPFTALTCE